MNTSKTIESPRKVGADYFALLYSRRSNLFLSDFVHQFDFENYWCFKATNHQRLVSKENFLNFKYAGYVFFEKDLYDVNNILEWIDWLKVNGGGGYLVKPTPPFNPNKITIKK